MAKLIAGLAGIFLYGSLGMASGVSDIPPPIANGTAAEAVSVGRADSTPPIVPQQISDDERERRQDECTRLYDHCYDWCSKSNKKRKDQEKCYRECSQKLADCMARIPD